MERCPNCRARYRGDPECHRCGMDLSLLLGIEARAERWERFAIRRLAAGDRPGATAAASRALALQHRPLAALLQGFVQQLPGDAPHALPHPEPAPSPRHPVFRSRVRYPAIGKPDRYRSA